MDEQPSRPAAARAAAGTPMGIATRIPTAAVRSGQGEQDA
jgi:hypothetical protein